MTIDFKRDAVHQIAARSRGFRAFGWEHLLALQMDESFRESSITGYFCGS